MELEKGIRAGDVDKLHSVEVNRGRASVWRCTVGSCAFRNPWMLNLLTGELHGAPGEFSGGSFDCSSSLFFYESPGL